MILTRDVAVALIHAQGVKELECGLSPFDIAARDFVENAFPTLKKNRIDSEFDSWIRSRACNDVRSVEAKTEFQRVLAVETTVKDRLRLKEAIVRNMASGVRKNGEHSKLRRLLRASDCRLAKATNNIHFVRGKVEDEMRKDIPGLIRAFEIETGQKFIQVAADPSGPLEPIVVDAISCDYDVDPTAALPVAMVAMGYMWNPVKKMFQFVGKESVGYMWNPAVKKMF